MFGTNLVLVGAECGIMILSQAKELSKDSKEEFQLTGLEIFWGLRQAGFGMIIFILT